MLKQCSYALKVVDPEFDKYRDEALSDALFANCTL